MPEHTVRSYDEELAHLIEAVVRMGSLAEASLADSLQTIIRRDASLTQTVIERDLTLDDLNRDIERRAIRMIALRQPVARDLRHTVAAMKIASNLERVGDLAKNIAKRGAVLAQTEPVAGLTGSIERVGRLVSGRLKDVLDAYRSDEIDPALAVWFHDDDVDEDCEVISRELLGFMMNETRTIAACAHLLFIAKNLERIGDHATNIAELVHYEVSGAELPMARPKRGALWQGGSVSTV